MATPLGDSRSIRTGNNLALVLSGRCGGRGYRAARSLRTVRLQLHALVCNHGNSLRILATPVPIQDWPLTSLKEKLIKIGAKVVSHGQSNAFQMAEVAIAGTPFADILWLIAEPLPTPDPAPA